MMVMMADRLLFTLSASLILILTISVQAEDSGRTRKLSTKFLCRPAAKTCPEILNETITWFNLAHTTAEGENDTLHYLISSHGGPAIIMAKTHLDAKLDINVEEFMSADPEKVKRSLNFSETPLYVSSLVFPGLLEYNDTVDKANIFEVPEKDVGAFTDLSSVTWLDSADYSSLKDNVIVLYNDASTDTQNASLKFKFEMFGNTSRNSELPHLVYNPDIMHMTVEMDNLQTSFVNSRFALMFVLISTDENNTESEFILSKTLDDGHSPGVFKMVDLNVHGEDQSSGAFLQWKPIAYTGHVRNISVLTKSTHGNLSRPELAKDKNYGLPLAVFGDWLFDKNYLNIVASNMSFGEPEDKFFVGYNYTLWTFSMGIGEPPKDQISLLIILIISIGLGVPVVLLFCGGIGVCVKRKRDNRPYSEITSSSYSAIQ